MKNSLDAKEQKRDRLSVENDFMEVGKCTHSAFLLVPARISHYTHKWSLSQAHAKVRGPI
jgi:hypothetical protein